MSALRAIATWLFAWLACASAAEFFTAPTDRCGTPAITFLVFVLTPVALFVVVTRSLMLWRGPWSPKRIDYATLAGEVIGTVGTAACWLSGVCR